jgi:LacI family transcriptional regulator
VSGWRSPTSDLRPSDGAEGVSPAHGKVTRADVARLAGVSEAVVSYVVNEGPRPVAVATAARVRDAIAALGYQPNPSARALRTGSTRLLGLVVPKIGNPLFADLALAVELAAAERGYTVLLANNQDDPAAERRHITNLIARQVDGLLLMTTLARPDLASLPLGGVPTVLVNTFTEVPGFASVGVDAFAGAYEAVTHLAGHGHRRIGLVIGGGGSDMELRERGWLEATRHAGLDDGPIAREPFTRRGGYDAGRRLFAGPDGPTAVFAGSDMQAIGVLRALHERGLRVPEDVALVSFDGTEDCEYTNPQLTVVRQPVAEIASSAVAWVLGADHPASTHVALRPELVLRRSCGCQPDLTN